MSTILLIDDDSSLHRLLGQYLEDSSFTVLHAGSGHDGLKFLFEHRPDLILLDVMMPRMDGWETLKRIRELTEVPVIFLTARGDEPDRLQGFRLGADDYIAKPFSFPELVARVQAVLRRSAHPPATSPPDEVLVCGPFRLDRTRHLITRREEPLVLTPTEYRLLEVLMERPGVVFS
ncbi:MAG: response regulator transcription factor, partial [Anaerolineae bacterium]